MEYIKVGSMIYNKNMEIVRTIPKQADLGGKDPDHVVELCNEVCLVHAFVCRLQLYPPFG